MATTYEKIQSTTLGGSQLAISFTSIPATYTDIRLVLVGVANAITANATVTFNSDTANNYSRTVLYGTGSAAGSGRDTNVPFIHLTSYDGLSPTIPSLRTMDVFSYAGSTYKTVLTEENSDYNGSGSVLRAVQMWRSTSAITSITITSNASYLFGTGTTATLYGILKA
jgi:hypothetical protein